MSAQPGQAAWDDSYALVVASCDLCGWLVTGTPGEVRARADGHLLTCKWRRPVSPEGTP